MINLYDGHKEKGATTLEFSFNDKGDPVEVKKSGQRIEYRTIFDEQWNSYRTAFFTQKEIEGEVLERIRRRGK